MGLLRKLYLVGIPPGLLYEDLEPVSAGDFWKDPTRLPFYRLSGFARLLLAA